MAGHWAHWTVVKSEGSMGRPSVDCLGGKSVEMLDLPMAAQWAVWRAHLMEQQ